MFLDPLVYSFQFTLDSHLPGYFLAVYIFAAAQIDPLINSPQIFASAKETDAQVTLCCVSWFSMPTYILV